MTGIVLDASAALKLIRIEQGSDDIRAILRDRIVAAEPIRVPALFWLEIVNVLSARYAVAPEALVEAIYELEQVGIETTEVGRPGVLAVIDAVARHGITAYDAAYLVLAESTDSHLVTADARVAAATGSRALLIGPTPRIGEAGITYDAIPPWPRWRGATDYLAELRSALG